MTVRAYVTFEDMANPVEASRIEAGWPARTDPRAVDDSDPDSWDLIPPGRALAEELAGGLQAHGFAVAFPVSQWEAYGWEFTVKADGRDVWFMLQASDEWLVMSEVPRGFLEKLRGVRFDEQHRKALSALASVLAPPRFANVRCFTRAEFNGREEGHAAP